MKKLISLLLVSLLLTGCGKMGAGSAPTSSSEVQLSQPSEETRLSGYNSLQRIPEVQACIMDEYRIYYEIFPGAYADANGDGMGDLRGILEKLPYLQDELGVGGLWLMPIHPSPSYHKYDVLDYCSVAPEYGTMEDFEALAAECDSRGIQLILDLVLNHTSSEHPWFLAAVRYLSGLTPKENPDRQVCPYVDYYHFLRGETCPPNHYPVPGAKNLYYEGHFGPHMPDLNLYSPDLRLEIREIMDFWIHKGVDGFRLDAVKEFESGKTEENLKLLRWVRETAESLKPHCFLVGEVWDSFSEISRYYESGIPGIFNYPFGGSDGKIVKVLRNAGNPKIVSTFAGALQKADSQYRSVNPDYVDAPFLSNHDVGRIAGFVNRDPNKVKLAGAMNLFMSGSVFLYYGEEIGMVSGAVNDPSYRAPMVWKPGQQQIQPPSGCTLPKTYPFGSLEEQKTDPDSVYQYYRAAAAIRNALPVLSHGVPAAETKLNTGCISAVRKTYYEQSCIVLMNISDQDAQADLSAYADWVFSASLTTGHAPVERQGNVLKLPPWGVAVLTKEE